jgi:hypothetical protein
LGRNKKVLHGLCKTLHVVFLPHGFYLEEAPFSQEVCIDGCWILELQDLLPSLNIMIQHLQILSSLGSELLEVGEPDDLGLMLGHLLWQLVGHRERR